MENWALPSGTSGNTVKTSKDSEEKGNIFVSFFPPFFFFFRTHHHFSEA